MRQTIARQTDYLARIVDELLDASRMTRGTFAITPKDVDLIEIVERALEMVRPEADRFQQSLTLHAPDATLSTKADADRLLQLLSNLLTNAVRFTPRGGSINVRVASRGDDIELAVQDNGRGIAPEDLQGIFGMFVQGKDAINRVGGGLGVGLSLARRIAELHG